ncbi:MAG TPA: hypothetical protein VFJ67_03785 [Thermodesulfobacteriota bacterium]|nr:hypothetical protein [Thermodesulfobacteriota bacterium]
MKKKEEFIYDVRVTSRHIREGVITKKDYDKHLSELPNVEEKSEPLIIEDEDGKAGGEPESGEE